MIDYVVEGCPPMQIGMVELKVGEELVEHLLVEFIGDYLEGKKLIVGNFRFPETEGKDGSQFVDVSFDATFLNVTEDENNQLLADNFFIVKRIAENLIKEAVEDANESQT